MVLDVHYTDVLRFTNLFHLERAVVDDAVDLALLGAGQYAYELISLLLAAGPICSRDLAGDARVVQFVWNQLGRCPEGWSEILAYPGATDQIRQQYEGKWGEIAEEYRTYDHLGLEKCLDANSGPIWKQNERLIKALDIGMRLNPPNDSVQELPPNDRIQVGHLNKQTTDIIDQVGILWQAGKIKSQDLAHAERLWPYLAQGLLLPAVRMTQSDVKVRGSMLVAAVRQRLKHEFAKTLMDGKTIKELVEIGDYNSLHVSGPGHTAWTAIDIVTSESLPQSLSQAPATPEAIAAAETRLGVHLPADYKEFLQVTNGIDVGQFGFYEGMGIYNGSISQMELTRVNDLVWSEQEDYETIIQLVEVGTLLYNITGRESWKAEHENWDLLDDFPQFERYLVIGREDTRMLLLLPPETIKDVKEMYMELYKFAEGAEKIGLKRAMESFAGGMEDFEQLEWVCVYVDDIGTMTGYRSFTRWLEEQVSGSFTVRSL